MKTILLDLKLFIILIIFSVLLFVFDNLGFLNFPKSLLQTLTIPVQFGLYKNSTNFKKQFTFIIEARKASLENNALKQQLALISAENATLQKKIKDTEDLVDQYNKLNPQTFDLIPARVLGVERYVILDKGINDGVVESQAVVYKDNYLGQTKNVTPKTSQVILATDPESKIAVFSQGSLGRAKGILTGEFGSEMLMDKILHEEVVNVDDLVYSEGTEGKLPKGLVMGKVTEVMERQNEIFKQAKVEPIFKLVDLDTVFLIK
ncbi:MAG: rod shape-determining protein MreC [Microgenomates group bacterium]|jgi:rod shape-determining protein MreC